MAIAIARAGLMCMGLGAGIMSHAAESEHRIVNFSTDVSRTVANDQLNATLYTELANKNQAALATAINETLNAALQIAKLYPAVVVTTGSQSTYPIYDSKDRRVASWRGQAALNLKSTDFRQAASLIAALQKTMLLQDLNFSVSSRLRQQTEQDLLGEATGAFQARAKAIQQAWGSGGYELVNMTYGTNNFDRPPVMMRAMAAGAIASPVPEQTMSGGDTQITLSAQGSIQLR